MIKQKAPKDMTVTEFVNLVERRYAVGTGCNMDAWINTLRMIAEEPAPNPFTPDQVAWMREMQRNGWSYATMYKRASPPIYWIELFSDEPDRNKDGEWNCTAGDHSQITASSLLFLANILDVDDPKPLCFADYAPLEGDKK